MDLADFNGHELHGRDVRSSYPHAVYLGKALAINPSENQEGSRNIAVLQEMDVGTLIGIPQQALLSGFSTIRNWVALAAMVEKLRAGFVECLSVYRTLMGTEIGL